MFDPLASASSDGDDTVLAGVLAAVLAGYLISAVNYGEVVNGSFKENINLILQLVLKVGKHYIVSVSAEVADGSVKKVQLVLYTELFEFRACGSVEMSSLAAVAHVYLVNVVHKLESLLLAYVFVKSSAEVVGNVVFTACSRCSFLFFLRQ